VPAVKLEEVAKYHMEGPANQPAFTMNPLVMLMNKQKYDNLSPELKAVVDKNSGMALVELAGNAWDAATVDARKKTNAAGNKTLVIKPEDYEAIRKASANVEQEWAKEVAPKGLDGAALVRQARAIGAQYLK
jgi:TRAP-type C4-dicarboxylate transport system substrate-binding protein